MSPRRPVRIGLTGPIGCGKSTVARLARRRGAPSSSTPTPWLARSRPPASRRHDAVVARFGDGAARRRRRRSTGRRSAGSCSRTRRRSRDLEAIVHPAVRPRILAAIDGAEATRAPAVVIEAIKLVEGGLAELCDEVWLVTCHEQRARLIAPRHGRQPTRIAGSRLRRGWPTVFGPRGPTWSRSTRPGASPRRTRVGALWGAVSARIQ